jgi:hypothetical protein
VPIGELLKWAHLSSPVDSWLERPRFALRQFAEDSHDGYEPCISAASDKRDKITNDEHLPRVLNRCGN